MNKTVFCLCGVLMGVMSSAQALDDANMQQQLDMLQQRVSELEQRLNVLEAPQIQQTIPEITGPEITGHSDAASNWTLLKVGYSYDKVRELLGEPVMVKSGAMEFWLYSDRGMDGGFVKFLFNKVNSWKGPQAK